MNEKVVVTGSSGMIGTVLSKRLLSNGYEVIGVDNRTNRWDDEVDECTIAADLRDSTALDTLPEEADYVIHLAANARVHRLVKHPRKAQDNLEMTFNVLEYVRTNSIPKVVFGSSREVYGNEGKVIYNEEDTYVDACESPYTASKVGSESMVKAYNQCYDVETAILRFSNVYGRYDLSDRVIPLFIAQASRNQDLTVYGDNKVLDFTYVDDCVDGIYHTISKFNKAKGMTFNIASGYGSSLVELAEIISDRIGADSKVHVEPNREGEVHRYIADINRAQKVLGYEPTHSLHDGLEKTIEWYYEDNNRIDEILK